MFISLSVDSGDGYEIISELKNIFSCFLKRLSDLKSLSYLATHLMKLYSDGFD
jgi:hypothetical protein